MTIQLPQQASLTIATPGDYQPSTIQIFLQNVANLYLVYISAKTQLVGLSGSFSQATIGAYTFQVIDPTLLGEIQAAAAASLVSLEASYDTLLAQVATYMTGASASGVV
jgi:hypothetical protein